MFFIGFAMITPMTSKLYREFFISLSLGGMSGGYYFNRYKKIYHAEVDSVYDIVKKSIKKFPELDVAKEDQQILKNFGFNVYNMYDEEDADENLTENVKKEPKIFDGTATMDRDETKTRVLSFFWGS
jgi:hypothetical protein